MPMKQINITIRIVGGKIGTIINQNFVEDIESIHTFVGILENLKAQQLEKLNNSNKVFKKGDNPDE